MADPHAFDLQEFLAKIGAGRTIVTCQKQRPIFTQGEIGTTRSRVSFFLNKFRQLSFID
jgi:hypothetical protein